MPTSLFRLAALLVCSVSILHAQSAQQIIKNVKQKFDQVKDYTVSVTASVNMERMKIPEMKAMVYFKQPDKFHVESKNFSMIPRESMGLNPSDMLAKYDATIVKTEKRNSTSFYELRMVSKPEKGKLVREYFVTINGDIWVVSHIESFPAAGRKVEIEFTHALVQDQYWLPSSMSVEYSTEKAESDAQAEPSAPAPNARGRQMPRNGSAVVRYTDYKVNTGLSDEIFEKKKDEKK